MVIFKKTHSISKLTESIRPWCNIEVASIDSVLELWLISSDKLLLESSVEYLYLFKIFMKEIYSNQINSAFIKFN